MPQYQKELRENARAIAQIQQAFGQKFTYSLAEQNIAQLNARINQIEAEQFVCPPGCYVCEYSVKRPYGIYYYYKLVSQEPIFPARSKKKEGQMVKTLHLGRYRNLAEAHAAAGWTARKAIDKMRRQIEFLEQMQQPLAMDATLEV